MNVPGQPVKVGWEGMAACFGIKGRRAVQNFELCQELEMSVARQPIKARPPMRYLELNWAVAAAMGSVGRRSALLAGRQAGE